MVTPLLYAHGGHRFEILHSRVGLSQFSASAQPTPCMPFPTQCAALRKYKESKRPGLPRFGGLSGHAEQQSSRLGKSGGQACKQKRVQLRAITDVLARIDLRSPTPHKSTDRSTWRGGGGGGSQTDEAPIDWCLRSQVMFVFFLVGGGCLFQKPHSTLKVLAKPEHLWHAVVRSDAWASMGNFQRSHGQTLVICLALFTTHS